MRKHKRPITRDIVVLDGLDQTNVAVRNQRFVLDMMSEFLVKFLADASDERQVQLDQRVSIVCGSHGRIVAPEKGFVLRKNRPLRFCGTFPWSACVRLPCRSDHPCSPMLPCTTRAVCWNKV